MKTIASGQRLQCEFSLKSHYSFLTAIFSGYIFKNGGSYLRYITCVLCFSLLRIVSLSTTEHCPENLDRVCAHIQRGVGALIVERLHNCEREECVGPWDLEIFQLQSRGGSRDLSQFLHFTKSSLL